jgi:hypothetical protein
MDNKRIIKLLEDIKQGTRCMPIYLQQELRDMQSRLSEEVTDGMSELAGNVSRECGYAMSRVLLERMKQNDKWGEQNHSYSDWLAILSEEEGETSKEYLEWKFGGRSNKPEFLDELTQVAGVALAMLECCIRKGWGDPIKRGCAACDRGDFSYGHANDCPKKQTEG